MRSEAWFWWLVFLGALVVRIAYLAVRPVELGGDERAYLELATSLADGAGYERQGVAETHISPLFPSLHAALIRLLGQVELAGVGFALVLGALVPLVVGWTFTRALDAHRGKWAAVAVALHPKTFAYAHEVQPELLSALLLLWFVALWIDRDIPWAGVVLGLGYLTRPELMLLLPAWLGLVLVRRDAAPRRVLLALVGFLAVALPFLLYLHAVEGRLCISGKDRWVYVLGLGQYLTNDGPVPMPLIRSLQAQVAGCAAHITEYPALFVRAYLFRASLLVQDTLSLVLLPVVPLVLMGLRVVLRNAGSARWPLLLPFQLALVIPAGLTVMRHAVPWLPILIGLAGVGACEGWTRFRKWRRWPVTSALR